MHQYYYPEIETGRQQTSLARLNRGQLYFEGLVASAFNGRAKSDEQLLDPDRAEIDSGRIPVAIDNGKAATSDRAPTMSVPLVRTEQGDTDKPTRRSASRQPLVLDRRAGLDRRPESPFGFWFNHGLQRECR